MSFTEVLIIVSIVLSGLSLSYPSIQSVKKSIDEQQTISRIIKNHELAVVDAYKNNRIVLANKTKYYPNLQVKPITLIIGKKKVSIGKYRQIRIYR